MKLHEAQLYAEKIMDTRGLREMGWTFEFDNAVRRFGCTHFSTKTITLSKKLTEMNHWPDVRDTILHEIGHAIAGHSAGHGYQWKNVVSVLGGNPSRTYDGNTVKTPPKAWTGTCPNCKRTIARHRRATKLACGRCCNEHNLGRWAQAYQFNWEKTA